MDKNPITIEVLETLDAIDRRQSFAKAAEELNKATSAVSYAVQKLEEQLDIAVFQRQGRRSVLTPAGQLILTEGREILEVTARLASKAKEVATGWEPMINIAVESMQSFPPLLTVLNEFLEQHPSIEIDIRESVLNGGWEALEHGQVDLLVGSPGPVPRQKGYRAIPMTNPGLELAISSNHPLAGLLANPSTFDTALEDVRRVITHDTSESGIARSAGLSSDGKRFYTQNIELKTEAILAGIGIGHLPLDRIQQYVDSGELIKLTTSDSASYDHFLVWKISNKGKGLAALTSRLAAALT
jgi:DNA-binding transcriptional LysR family regulator